jgi:hypothetical protein
MWSGGIIGQWHVILLGVQETRESIMMNIRPKLKNLILDSKVSGLNALVLFEEFKCKYGLLIKLDCSSIPLS